MHDGDTNTNTGQTILVVEDEALVRMDICETLRMHGYNVLEATNADEALRMLDHDPNVQLVFTDIRMPGKLDGLDLAQVAVKRELPVVISSGHLSSHEVAADIGPLLIKPYRHSDILSEIRRKLTGAK